MFNRINFISHSGKALDWKIECDDLSDEDLATLAYVLSKHLQFGSVHGILTGGLRFAEALRPYCGKDPKLPRLVVDDVLTTGSSMEQEYQPGDIGVVIFARGNCPFWITPIFRIATSFTQRMNSAAPLGVR